MDIVLDNTVLKVFKNGDVMRKMAGKGGWWKEIPRGANCDAGYNSIRCKNKIFYRHRIMGYCYLGLDIYDTERKVDHIDTDRLNNDIMNLRVVSQQENNFNRSNVKGYYWHKKTKKWHASIRFNYKNISLGYWDTEAQARLAYLEAKDKYHIFTNA